MSDVRRETGTYALVLRCIAPDTVQVGKLGKLAMRAGTYIYVGSAFGPGGVAARLQHHGHSRAQPHWHIDYIRSAVETTAIWYSHDPQRREHQWTDIIMHAHGAAIAMPGFGASDCGCAAHLFYFRTLPSASAFRRRVHKAIPDHGRIYCGRAV